MESLPDEESGIVFEKKKQSALYESDSVTSETVLTTRSRTTIPIIAAWWRNYRRDGQSNIQRDENGFYKCIKERHSPPLDEVELSTSTDNGTVSSYQIKISHNFLKKKIFECMKFTTSGNVQILEDIASGKITVELAEQQFITKPTMEKNILFLWSAFNNRLDLMENLFKYGVDIHSCEPTEGFTALHLSAFSDSVECTKFLISCGVDVNFTPEKYTPLETACFHNSFEVAKLLLENGAKVNVERKIETKEHIYYGTPLHSAVKANAVECVKLLLSQGANINPTKNGEISPLHIAAELGHLCCIEMLLEGGADPNVVVRDTQNTPLHLAADGGFMECISLLLSKGAKTGGRNNKGQTELHMAVCAQSLDCVEILLRKGSCDPNSEDNKKCTPLHSAFGASVHSCEITDLLISSGADVNKQNIYGYTPLHLAVLSECIQCIEVLVNNNADVTLRTAGGNTALGIIIRKTPLALPVLYKKLDSAITIYDPELSYSTDEIMKFDFQMLMQPNQKEEINFLKTVLDEGQKEILEHPLCRAFLHVKWGKIRKYYFARLMFYGLLVLCLTGYIFTIFHNCYNVEVQNVTEYLCLKNITIEEFQQDYAHPIQIQRYFLLFFIICETVRKSCVLMGCTSIRNYFFRKNNILEWFVLICGIIIACWPIGESGWHNQVAAFTVLFAWINLMHLIGQLPILGSYITMYIKVQKNFAKLFVAYICLLIGFTFSFCVILPTKIYFENPLYGFVKVVSMMLSSIDYKELIFDMKDSIILPSTHIIFLMFMLYGTIIMMNLLIGIAVHDIQGLQKTAGLSRLVCQTKLITSMEVLLFKTWLPKCVLFMFRYLTLISPFGYRVVLKVKPLNSKENRLPKDILKDAYDTVKLRKHNFNTSSVNFHNQSFSGSKTNYSRRYQQQQSPPKSSVTIQNLKKGERDDANAIARLTQEIQELKLMLRSIQIKLN